MVQRNLALGLASLVAIAVSCSDHDYKSAPDFSSAQEAVGSKNSDVADHGPTSEVESMTSVDAAAADQEVQETAAVTPPPATANTAVTPTAPGATPEDKFKAMLAAGKVMNTVNIAAGQGKAWGTSTTARLEVFVAVDAAGAVVMPAATITARQIPSGTTAAPIDAKFKAGAADVATLHSSLRVCNDSGEAIYLHSGNGAPFSHGSGPIATGTCAQFLAQRAVAGDGATYDHTDGNNIANYVYLKVTKIGPDGKIVP